MTKKATKATGGESDAGADKPQGEKRERRKPMTNAELIAAYKAQGGKCYVTGEELSDATEQIDGKLVTGSVKAYAGQRGLSEVRAKLEDELAEAAALTKRYGKLTDKEGCVTFAGEATKPEAPVAASEKAGDGAMG